MTVSLKSNSFISTISPSVNFKSKVAPGGTFIPDSGGGGETAEEKELKTVVFSAFSCSREYDSISRCYGGISISSIKWTDYFSDPQKIKAIIFSDGTYLTSGSSTYMPDNGIWSADNNWGPVYTDTNPASTEYFTRTNFYSNTAFPGYFFPCYPFPRHLTYTDAKSKRYWKPEYLEPYTEESSTTSSEASYGLIFGDDGYIYGFMRCVKGTDGVIYHWGVSSSSSVGSSTYSYLRINYEE